MADEKFDDKLKGKLPSSCLMHFDGVNENLFKVSRLRLKKFAECREKWAKFHCEQAEIAKRSYDILGDSNLNSHLLKDGETLNLDLYYHKTCYKKFCDEEKINRQQKKEDSVNISSQVEMEVTAPPVGLEPKRKVTRNSDALPSKAMPQRNKHVLPECCIICGRDSSWFTRDKVRLNPEFVY